MKSMTAKDKKTRSASLRDLKLLKNLCEFFRRCDRTEMLEIYGERFGDHLWNKFNFLHRDWAWWLCNLDSGNLEKLVEHISK